MVDIMKPLRRGVCLAVSRTETRLLGIKYERLLNFCFACGRIGHSQKGCEFMEEEKELSTVSEYGPWLRAESRLRDGVSQAENGADKKQMNELYEKRSSTKRVVMVHGELGLVDLGFSGPKLLGRWGSRGVFDQRETRSGFVHKWMVLSISFNRTAGYAQILIRPLSIAYIHGFLGGFG